MYCCSCGQCYLVGYSMWICSKWCPPQSTLTACCYPPLSCRTTPRPFRVSPWAFLTTLHFRQRSLKPSSRYGRTRESRSASGGPMSTSWMTLHHSEFTWLLPWQQIFPWYWKCRGRIGRWVLVVPMCASSVLNAQTWLRTSCIGSANE